MDAHLIDVTGVTDVKYITITFFILFSEMSDCHDNHVVVVVLVAVVVTHCPGHSHICMGIYSDLLSMLLLDQVSYWLFEL